MDELTADELISTIEAGSGTCVSLFMPTHRAGQQVEQDRIRFKNLLRDADERLVATGLRTPEARRVLEPAHKLLDDGIFWKHGSDGLAVFVASDVFRYYRVPALVEELVVVSSRFHVKPLLALLNPAGEFFVLALSQKKVRLFCETRFSVREVDLPGAPKGLADAIKYEQPERQVQLHTGPGTRAGRGKIALFHGHGGKSEDAKDIILAYFRLIDASVRKLLSGDHAPLVLAGVEYLFPIYREANTYPHLVEAGIPGNADEADIAELHRRAWEVVRPKFEAARQAAFAKYEELAGGAHASSDLKEAVAAACTGRVETVFVALDEQRWGRLDAASCDVALHEAAEPGDEDLLDVAASQTLLHRGNVYAVGAGDVPGEGALAAVFRY